MNEAILALLLEKNIIFLMISCLSIAARSFGQAQSYDDVFLLCHTFGLPGGEFWLDTPYVCQNHTQDIAHA